MTPTQPTISGGLVWILSGLALLVYSAIGLSNTTIPGVEELVNFIRSTEGTYLYLGAFLAIFIEGLYFLGSFFPGSTIVLLIAIVSQAGGTAQFLGIILTIYVGWLLAGVCNILGAWVFSYRLTKVDSPTLEDNTGLTWFPAFRANTEVAQITEGHRPLQVFWSSWRVKSIACIGAALYALIIPLFIDIGSMNNEEGFWSLLIIAAINFAVGGHKIFLVQQ